MLPQEDEYKLSVSSIMEDEIVNVPVPKRLLPVVIQAMANAMKPESATTIENTVLEGEPKQVAIPLPAHPKPIDWTLVSNMKTLRKGLNSLIAIKLLDMTAASPGKLISFREIYTAAGFTETRRAGSSIGSMTKVIKRDFGVPVKEAFWPVEHHWSVDNDAQYHYRMLPEVAEAWLQSAA